MITTRTKSKKKGEIKEGGVVASGIPVMKGYKFWLKTSYADEVILFGWMSKLRYVWNHGLEFMIYSKKNDGYYPSYEDNCLLLPYLKEAFPFLSEVPSQPLQQLLKRLDKAFERYLSKGDDHLEHPKFKRYKDALTHPPSLRFPVAPKIVNRCIELPKLRFLRMVMTRKLEGKPKNFTISYEDGRFWVSIQCELEPVALIQGPVLPEAVVGLDLGVKRSITLSDELFAELAVKTEEERRRMVFCERKRAKCEMGSIKYKVWSLRIARSYRAIRNRVLDAKHKITHYIAMNYSYVVVEGLRVKDMMASAAGTLEVPGMNVAQKAGLNRVIGQQGWAETIRQLIYKLSWLGKELIVVDPKNSSRECSRCSHTEKGNRKTQADFVCLCCNFKTNADLNAAMVLRKRALVRLGLFGLLDGAGTQPLKLWSRETFSFSAMYARDTCLTPFSFSKTASPQGLAGNLGISGL